MYKTIVYYILLTIEVTTAIKTYAVNWLKTLFHIITRLKHWAENVFAQAKNVVYLTFYLPMVLTCPTQYVKCLII